MTSFVQKQPSTLNVFNAEQDPIETQTMIKDPSQVGEDLSSRDNFPKGLRGGGACFDCLACLCFCCAIEEIACFECCKDC